MKKQVSLSGRIPMLKLLYCPNRRGVRSSFSDSSVHLPLQRPLAQLIMFVIGLIALAGAVDYQNCTGDHILDAIFLQGGCTNLTGTLSVLQPCDMSNFTLLAVNTLNIIASNLIDLSGFETLLSVDTLNIQNNLLLQNLAGLSNNLRAVGSVQITMNPMLSDINFPLLKPAPRTLQMAVEDNPALTSLVCLVLTDTYYLSILRNTMLSTLRFPSLVKASTLRLWDVSDVISFPVLRIITSTLELTRTSINSIAWFPSLSNVGYGLSVEAGDWDGSGLSNTTDLKLTNVSLVNFKGWGPLPNIINVEMSSMPNLESLDGLILHSIYLIDISDAPHLLSVDALASITDIEYVDFLKIDSNFCCPSPGVFPPGSVIISTIQALCLICTDFVSSGLTQATPGLQLAVPAHVSSSYAGSLNVHFCDQNVWFAQSSCLVTQSQSVDCEVPLLPVGQYYLSWNHGCVNISVGNRAVNASPVYTPLINVQNWSTYYQLNLPPKEPANSEPINGVVYGDGVPGVRNDYIPTVQWEAPVLCTIIAVEILIYIVLRYKNKLDLLLDIDNLGYHRAKLDSHGDGKPATEGSGRGPDRLVTKRRTPLGGLLTAFVVVAASAIGIGYVTEALETNIYSSTTLDPNIASETIPTSVYHANITLTGYHGSCVATGTGSATDPLTGNCSPDLSVVTQGRTSGPISTSCTLLPIEPAIRLDTGCLVQWTCQSCSLGLSTVISVQSDVNFFASGFEWSLSSQSYIGTEHRVASSINAPPGYFFKGTPSGVTITATVAKFSSLASPIPSRGMLLKHIGVQAGSLQSPESFSSLDGGAQINIEIIRNLNVLVITESMRRTGMDIFAGTIAIFSGILQGGRILSFTVSSAYKKVEHL